MPTIRKHSGRKPYRTLSEHIRLQILNGRYASGAMLPSENELTGLLGASRMTVRKALTDLANEGLVESHRGRGWLVRGPGNGAGRKTRIVEAIGGLQDYVHAIIAEGMREALPEDDLKIQWHILREHRGESRHKERKELAESVSCDAMVVVENKRLPPDEIDFYRTRPFPVIVAGSSESLPLDTAAMDYFQASVETVDRLIAEHCGHIVFLADDHLNEAVPSFRDREEGYEVAMKRHQLMPRRLAVTHAQLVMGGRTDTAMMEEIDATEGAPIGFFSGASYPLSALLAPFGRMGRFPSDRLRLAGYIHMDMSLRDFEALHLPSLHGITDNWRAVGQTVGARLLARWNAPDLPACRTLVPAHCDGIFDEERKFEMEGTASENK